jgi:hypothetical protein
MAAFGPDPQFAAMQRDVGNRGEAASGHAAATKNVTPRE